MKKISVLICCVLIFQILCACSNQKEELQEPVNFYYCNKEITFNTSSGVICAEAREGAGFHGNLTAFLHAYLIGPQSNTLNNVFPSDAYLVSWEMEDDTIKIVFSQKLEQLSGMDLSVACSALLLTLHDYVGVNTAIITAKNAQLNERDQFIISMDDLVLIDSTK